MMRPFDTTPANAESENAGHIQDGVIKDAEDFWQLIMDVGYIMEGESRQYEREKLAWLNTCLDTWFLEHPEITLGKHPKITKHGIEQPEITEPTPLEHFAMHAVHRLVGAFVFNDQADDPDAKERMRARFAEPMAQAIQWMLQEMRDDGERKDNSPPAPPDTAPNIEEDRK